MDNNLERIIREGDAIISPRDKSDFRFFVMRFFSRWTPPEKIAIADGRDVADMFLEMLS